MEVKLRPNRLAVARCFGVFFRPCGLRAARVTGSLRLKTVMAGLLQPLIIVKSKLEIAPVTEKGQSHLKYNYGTSTSTVAIVQL